MDLSEAGRLLTQVLPFVVSTSQTAALCQNTAVIFEEIIP